MWHACQLDDSSKYDGVCGVPLGAISYADVSDYCIKDFILNRVATAVHRINSIILFYYNYF